MMASIGVAEIFSGSLLLIKKGYLKNKPGYRTGKIWQAFSSKAAAETNSQDKQVFNDAFIISLSKRWQKIQRDYFQVACPADEAT